VFSWHWFFMVQPFDFPERLIGADPDYYLRRKLAKTEQGLAFFDEAALQDWLRCLKDPATVHAMCEDYRATFTVDLDMDTTDFAAGRRIDCPALVIWGATGGVGRNPRVREIWPRYAGDIRRMAALPCGHYLTEEAPAETEAELRGFFAAS
jgi:haloacetate dehalogenase